MPLPGEIWLANIPYTDGRASKIRPVLVLWIDAADCVVAAVTSAAPRSTSDVPLVDWRTAGLRVPSTARLSRLDCLDQILLAKKLGRVGLRDATQLKIVWKQQIQLNF
jgi:mRNA interferase MazF